MFKLDNRVAIVTGSGYSEGLGYTMAKALAAQGAKVIITDLNLEYAKSTAQEIIDSGQEAMAYELDVKNEEQVKELVSDVLKEYGKIDILVNNAGIAKGTRVENMETDEAREIFEVNFFGLLALTREVLKPMKEQNYGRIVNISSIAGKRGGGLFGGAHYSASKAAVLGFSKNLAREVAEYGITVNSVAPGLVKTNIWRDLPQDRFKQIIKETPLNRPGEREEIAAAVAFLASDEASYITGEDIDVNGGLHMD